MFHDQSSDDVRCEWGLPGIQSIARDADVVVIVDTLSFSTCVDVAISRGAQIIPFRWKDNRASEYAVQMGAELASARGQSGNFSLSPVSMQFAVEGTRIVLPSPNGSELSLEAGSLSPIVLAGCFRNYRAVAQYCATVGTVVSVIPAGERWPDGTLRFAIEDLAAAGAIIANLPGKRSSESIAAVAVWEFAKNRLDEFLATCASGRELIERGFEKDVHVAGETDVSKAIPILHKEAFRKIEPPSNPIDRFQNG